jgi:hypothetical protein
MQPNFELCAGVSTSLFCLNCFIFDFLLNHSTWLKMRLICCGFSLLKGSLSQRNYVMFWIIVFRMVALVCKILSVHYC